MFSSQQRIKALWSIQLDKSHLCLTGEEKPPRFLNSESAAACSKLTRNVSAEGEMRTQALERRNTNLWPVEGLNQCFTDLKNWLVPKEVELPLVALPAAGVGLRLSPSQLCPCPFHLQAPPAPWGSQFWSLWYRALGFTEERPCLQIHFLLLSIHFLF